MNFSEQAINNLVERYPRPRDFERAIEYLQTLPVSSTIRRRYFGQWAKVVGHAPTSDEYDRAARDAASSPKENR